MYVQFQYLVHNQFLLEEGTKQISALYQILLGDTEKHVLNCNRFHLLFFQSNQRLGHSMFWGRVDSKVWFLANHDEMYHPILRFEKRFGCRRSFQYNRRGIFLWLSSHVWFASASRWYSPFLYSHKKMAVEVFICFVFSICLLLPLCKGILAFLKRNRSNRYSCTCSICLEPCPDIDVCNVCKIRLHTSCQIEYHRRSRTDLCPICRQTLIGHTSETRLGRAVIIGQLYRMINEIEEAIDNENSFAVGDLLRDIKKLICNDPMLRKNKTLHMAFKIQMRDLTRNHPNWSFLQAI